MNAGAPDGPPVPAIVFPIWNPTKDLFESLSYCSTALISCVCKTMEIIIKNHLILILTWSDRSTYYAFRKVTIAHVVSIFFDLDHVYDTTWKYDLQKTDDYPISFHLFFLAYTIWKWKLIERFILSLAWKCNYK